MGFPQALPSITTRYEPAPVHLVVMVTCPGREELVVIGNWDT